MQIEKQKKVKTEEKKRKLGLRKLMIIAIVAFLVPFVVVVGCNISAKKIEEEPSSPPQNNKKDNMDKKRKEEYLKRFLDEKEGEVY